MLKYDRITSFLWFKNPTNMPWNMTSAVLKVLELFIGYIDVSTKKNKWKKRKKKQKENNKKTTNWTKTTKKGYINKYQLKEVLGLWVDLNLLPWFNNL